MSGRAAAVITVNMVELHEQFVGKKRRSTQVVVRKCDVF